MFRLTHHANACPILADLSERQVANASGYIRENQGYLLKDRADIEFLKDLKTPSVGERAHKLLRALSKMYPAAGTEIFPRILHLDNQIQLFRGIDSRGFEPDENGGRAAVQMFPYLGFSWSESGNELMYILMDYLCDGVGYLTGEPYRLQSGGFTPCKVAISPSGWEFLEESGLSDGSTGFVAMWFDDSMDLPWKEAIYPAIVDAGYEPLRIDKREHNNKIDDEIVASIRRSRFVVADFTGGRGGVYYEAGFAHGLDIPVIWSVRKDWLSQLHFDTRQFNHIPWSDSDLASFRSALKFRIEATLGKGPIK